MFFLLSSFLGLSALGTSIALVYLARSLSAHTASVTAGLQNVQQTLITVLSDVRTS